MIKEDRWQKASERNGNCFPNCSTFEKDEQSQLFFCIECGILERDIIAWEKFREEKFGKDF